MRAAFLEKFANDLQREAERLERVARGTGLDAEFARHMAPLIRSDAVAMRDPRSDLYRFGLETDCLTLSRRMR